MTASGGRASAAVGSWLAPVACAAVVLAVLLLVVPAQPGGVFWDDGVYVITARAIAAGEGYRFVHLPGSPPAVHFPPGWPLVLAAAWRIWPSFPGNLGTFASLNLVLAAAGAGLTCAYAIRRARIAPVSAFVVVSVFALTLPVIVLDSVLFAEPLFLVVTVGALFVADRAAESGGTRWALAAGVAAAAATLVRTSALPLVFAVVGALLIARRPRQATAAAVSSVALLAPWLVWSASRAGDLAGPLRGNYGPYAAWLSDAVRERGAAFVAAIAASNAAAVERSFAVVFFPVGVRPLRPLLIALLCVVVALGIGALWRRVPVLVLFVVGYAALVLVWPYAPDRFAWAVWPVVGVVVAAGAGSAWQMASRADHGPGPRVAAAIALAVAVLAVSGDAFYSARGISRGWVDVAQRRNAARLEPVADWVVRHTPPGAVVAADGEPFVHLYTGRRVVPVHVLSPDEYLAGTPLQLAADDLRALLAAGGADFAVLSARSAEISAADLLSRGSGSPWLTPIDTLPGGGVAYRVDRSR